MKKDTADPLRYAREVVGGDPMARHLGIEVLLRTARRSQQRERLGVVGAAGRDRRRGALRERAAADDTTVERARLRVDAPRTRTAEATVDLCHQRKRRERRRGVLRAQEHALRQVRHVVGRGGLLVADDRAVGPVGGERRAVVGRRSAGYRARAGDVEPATEDATRNRRGTGQSAARGDVYARRRVRSVAAGESRARGWCGRSTRNLVPTRASCASWSSLATPKTHACGRPSTGSCRSSETTGCGSAAVPGVAAACGLRLTSCA